MWKYHSNVTQFWFLIPYIIFLSFFSFFFFSSIHFFFPFLFSCFFSPTHEHLPPISIFTLCLTFCFSSYLQTFLPFSLSLTHTNFSPSISHKQILFHTHIDHRQRTKIRVLPTSKNISLITILVRSAFYMVFFFFLFWFD